MYMAAGFFNDEQRRLCSFIESFETPEFPIYSPRNDGFVLKPDATAEERQEIFLSNTEAIDHAAFMLAWIDDFDTGVIWEMGYAHARGCPILAFSIVEGRGLNVMLAGACDLGFINGRDTLQGILGQLGQGRFIQHLAPRNTWRGEIQ